jgi:protein O-mannosyl-transferase
MIYAASEPVMSIRRSRMMPSSNDILTAWRKRCDEQPAALANTNRFFGPAALLLISIVTFLVYLPAMNGKQIWDDDVHVTKPELRTLHGLWRIWFEKHATQQYYPLLHSAFWLEHKLWGDSVVGYHLVNVLWHVISVTLLYFVLKRLKVPGALLATTIFALHPVMVESVAWISEQKNTLSAVFYLSAMLVYLEFDASRRRSRYFIALGLFALGLLTKTVTATLPAALLVIFWWQRGTLSWKRDVLPLAPFFVLGAAAGALTAWLERKQIGAEGAAFEISFLERGLIAGRVIWFYLGKLMWPTNLTFIYPRWEIDSAVWWQWLFPAAALGVMVLLWSLRRVSRGPLAGWLLFVGTLVPVLGFLNVFPFIYSFVADHFQYLASLGIIVLISAGIVLGLQQLPQALRYLGGAVCILLLATMSILTWQQTGMYADAIRLFQTTLDRNPSCWMAHNNLGVEYFAIHDLQHSGEHFRASLKINPLNPAALCNLAATLAEQGQLPEAIEKFQAGIQLSPSYSSAYSNLGIALAKVGRLPEALESFRSAVSYMPEDVQAINNLAVALTNSNRHPEAIALLERAIHLQPDSAESHEHLANALLRGGQTPQAIEQYELATRINPNIVEAHYHLGLLLSDVDKDEEAISHFEQAVRLAPKITKIQNGFGNLLRKAGRNKDAIEHYQAALRLEPNSVGVYANLAQSLAAVGRTDEALATAQKGAKIAHSSGNQTVSEKIDDWMKDFQAELERGRKAESPTRSRPPAVEQKQSK